MTDRNQSKSGTFTGVRGLIHRNQTIAFFVVTLAISWGWWAVAYFVLANDGLTLIHLGVGAFGPVVAAALVSWVSGTDLRAWAAQIVDWRVSPHWYLIVLVVPALWGLGSVPAGLAVAGIPFDVTLSVDQVIQYVISTLIILFIGGGQEEPGWRGFALPRLQETYSSLTASLIIGVVWAVWHLPLFFMGAARNLSGSFLLFAVMTVGISIPLTWCYNSTGGSVLLAMLFHAGINASPALLPVQSELSEQWPLVFDIGLTAGVWIIAVAVVAWSGIDSLSRTGIPDPTNAGVTVSD